MRIILVLVLLPLAWLGSAESDKPVVMPDPLTWIPTAIDDWAALQAEAAAFKSGTTVQRETFVAIRQDRIDPIPSLPRDLFDLIPTTALGDDLIALRMIVQIKLQGQGCGETAVWRGVDGQAIGAVVFWQPNIFANETRVPSRILSRPPPNSAHG